MGGRRTREDSWMSVDICNTKAEEDMVGVGEGNGRAGHGSEEEVEE